MKEENKIIGINVFFMLLWLLILYLTMVPRYFENNQIVGGTLFLVSSILLFGSSLYTGWRWFTDD